MRKISIILAFSTVFAFNKGYSKEDVVSGGKAGFIPAKTLVDCAQSTSREVLEINNVRTLLQNGGDMWWTITSPSAPRYEIPKQDDPSSPKKHSLFAGSIWIGGNDVSTGALLVLANTYRQSSYSMWPGPLDVSGPNQAQISAEECQTWDAHFKVSREIIEQYVDDYAAGLIQTEEDVPQEILNWPGRLNPYITGTGGTFDDKTVNMDRQLAPFDEFVQVEENGAGDGIYDPLQGDIPFIYGDESIWWVMNDAGNQKQLGGTQGSLPIGMEIQVMGFGFATNDVLNDMTFYWNRLLNRGSQVLSETRMGQWVDPDLGFPQDDYVEVDVPRGLGICYNGDEFDEGIAGYGENPPSIGVDYFEGPFADKDTIGDGIDNDGDGVIDEPDRGFAVYEGDGIDNDKDGIVDETDELIIMSNFLYYNNDQNVTNGNPGSAQDFNNYLRNIWRDGQLCTYDLAQGIDQTFPACNFMFPGTSDLEIGWGLGGTVQQPYAGPSNVPWDETVAGNQPNDRRLLQSAGPFTLEPGALNELTIGIPWARTGAGGARGSLDKLKVADDICQKLFDNDFQLLNGPDAPNVTVTELDGEVILSIEPSEFTLINQGQRTRYTTETYEEFDANVGDYYRFEGYLFYQLADNTVTEADLNNPDRARLIAQCDVANGVTRIVNYENDITLGDDVFVPTIKVEGSDQGLFRTVRIEDDAFAEGDPKLVNHRSYVYLVLAYGYNARMAEINLGSSVGDRKELPFIVGRRNGVRKVAIPHKPVGNIVNSTYGDEFEITTISGQGNGGNILELSPGVEEEILSGELKDLKYEAGSGPVRLKVYDPKLVESIDDLRLTLTSRLDYSKSSNGFKFLEGDTLVSIGNYTSNTVLGNIQLRPNQAVLQIPGEAVVIREVAELETDETKTLEVRLLNGKDGGAFARDVYRVRVDGTETSRLGAEIEPVNFQLKGDSTSVTSCVDFKAYDLWTLEGNGVVVKGSVPVSASGEQTIPEFGLSVEMANGANPGYRSSLPGFEENGFLDASISYEERVQEWIVPIDGANIPWVSTNSGGATPLDQLNVYRNILQGSFAPWVFANSNSSSTSVAPAPITGASKTLIRNLPNVDIVITSDKSKWTRAMVIQMDTFGAAQGPAPLIRSQKSTNPSVNKEGQPDGSLAVFPEGTTELSKGYGWFPGYAIDIDKGIRLNMAFTENQFYDSITGDDLRYNPDSTDFNQHYFMVANTEYDMETSDSEYQKLWDSIFVNQRAQAVTSTVYGPIFGRTFTWTGILKTNPIFRNIPEENRTDVRINLRVNKSYIATDNGEQPEWSFNTTGSQYISSRSQAQDDLEDIRVVPNPYYAYSEYEQSQVDKRVKITNLPSECTISIFTMSGSLIRQFKRNVQGDIPGAGLTSQDWELTNAEGIPVASGVYIIHVDAGELGEKVVKFFHINRPIDLDTF